MPLNYQWQHQTVNWRNIEEYIVALKQSKVTFIALDTETTGLKLTKDKPFYISLAYNGKAVGIDLDRMPDGSLKRLMDTIYEKTAKGMLIGHNLIYDLNMLHNLGYPVPHKQLMDTMILIRLGTEAIQEKHGGAPLGLKRFATQYIDENASYYSKQIDIARMNLAKEFNQKLFQVLPKKELMAVLDQFPNDVDDLDPISRQTYLNWKAHLPERVRENMSESLVRTGDIPYNLINRKLLESYATYDAIYTYEIFDLLYPKIELLAQGATLKLEQELLYPLYKMARRGFYMDKAYILATKNNMKSYIRERIQTFKTLAGKDITHNQVKELLEVLRNRFGLVDLTSTNEPTLLEYMNQILRTDPHNPVIEFIKLVFELRTLSKWYSTYLMKFATACEYDDYIHTSINPAGAITGRFTSDFQQFPRDGIKDVYGNSLFHPRKMIIRPDKDHYLLFIDYSQMELRIQALYTILLENPDLNLCRAYMPYKCYHHKTNEEFSYTKHLDRWNEKKEDGTSAWHLEEDGTPWQAIDLHAQMTANAYPHIERGSKEFIQLRKNVGKHANFACNYGAKAKRLYEMFPNMSWEEAQAIYQAYKDTFPGTVYYQNWCYRTTAANGFGENLFGRKYYNMSGHNYLNAAIQGTGADLLKQKMIELHNFLDDKKSKLIMTVHDELIFLLHHDEIEIIDDLKHIMENLEGSYVPIVVDAEISNTSWAEKKGFKITNGLLTIDT